MPFIPRDEIVRRLRAQADAGVPIVGCGAGTGLSAMTRAARMRVSPAATIAAMAPASAQVPSG